MLKSLDKLMGSSAQVTGNNAYPPENGYASVLITFAEGTVLRADYWRLTKDGGAFISSFDHNQKYGLPAPIDAIDSLKKELQNQTLTEARLDKETGDLLFGFTNNIKLQVFNFTSYEIWEIAFPNGSVEYSNYAK